MSAVVHSASDLQPVASHAPPTQAKLVVSFGGQSAGVLQLGRQLAMSGAPPLPLPLLPLPLLPLPLLPLPLLPLPLLVDGPEALVPPCPTLVPPPPDELPAPPEQAARARKTASNHTP